MVAKRTWLVGAVVAISMLAATPAAQGTVPGKDGVIVYSSAGGDLFSMNANGTGKVRLMRTAAQETEPAFAPCGCKLAFTSYTNGNYDIWVMNTDGTGRFKLIGWASQDDEPAWSPDGTKIAFSSWHDGNAEIYVVQATKVHPAPVKLTHTATSLNLQPDWSPDGTRIAWSFSGQIYTMNATTGLGKKPAGFSFPCYQEWPSWSPDGTKIAYSGGSGCGANDYDQIWVAPVGGSSAPVAITPNNQYYEQPQWAPSGASIVYSSDSGIQSRRPDGTGLLKLTFRYGDSRPTWQPLPLS